MRILSNLLSSSFYGVEVLFALFYSIFVALVFDLCWRSWFMFAVKSYEIILENLYFLFPISEKLGCQILPIYEQRQQFSFYVWTVNTTWYCWYKLSSNNFIQLLRSWLLMFGIVCMKYVFLCLNPVIKHEYAASSSYYAILHKIRNSMIHWLIQSYVFWWQLYTWKSIIVFKNIYAEISL